MVDDGWWMMDGGWGMGDDGDFSLVRRKVDDGLK